MRNEEGRWETGVTGLEGEWRSEGDFIFTFFMLVPTKLLASSLNCGNLKNKYYELLHAFMATHFTISML